MRVIKETKEFVHIETEPEGFVYQMPKISIKDKIKMYSEIRRKTIIGYEFCVTPICPQIEIFYIKKTSHVFSYMHIEFMFPEFFKHKPIGIPTHHLWWNSGDRITRIRILTQIINELKHTTNAKSNNRNK